MTFLQHRLNEVTSHKLEIAPMQNFLTGLSTNQSQSTKERAKSFLKKWEDHNYHKKLKIAYISGSWTPTLMGTKNIRVQSPWDEFIRTNFFSSVGSITIGQASEDFRPFNFKELVQMSYWKELYRAFGFPAVAFIFEKCLIIEETDENLFLIISSENCMLNKKLHAATTAKRIAVRMDSGESVNPYLLSNIEGLDKTAPDSDIPKPRKRRRLVSENLSEHFSKQVQLQSDSGSVPACNAVLQNSQGLIRWFIPAEKVLKFIIDERDKLKAKNGINSVLHKVVDGTTHLNYVGIVEDGHFLKIGGGDLCSIVKQSCLIKFPLKRLPSQWEGLKINETSNVTNSSVYVNVFKISEAFAKENNIRLKTKQRRKRSLNKASSQDVNQTESSHASRHLPTPEINANLCVPVPSTSEPSMGKSFDPAMSLEMLPALYNKSSWTRWPQNHSILAACNADSSNQGTKLLIQCIFNSPVGSSINTTLLRVISESKLQTLTENIHEVILFHKRMKNFHIVVRSCLTFWMIKKQIKLKKRQAAKAERQAWEGRTVKIPGCVLTKSRLSKSIEMIDLTRDTPSTSSPTPEFHSNNDITFKSSTSFEISGNTRFNESKSHDYTLSGEKVNVKSCIQQRRAFAYEKLKENVPYTCLIMCIKQIFRLGKVEKLLGSKKNIRGFFTFLRKSVILAGTKSSLQLGQLMALLDPKDCPWLDCIENANHKIAFLAKCVKWLFVDYVMVILRTSFYITEISDSRMHARFYLRESWKSISEHLKHRFTKSGVLRRVSTIPIRKLQTIQSTEAINARIRFIPKKNRDLRPILSLLRGQQTLTTVKRWTLLINHLVRKLSPHRTRDTNAMRQRWLKFLQYWNKKSRPKLYCVRADIQDAYPSVNISKLKGILVNASQRLGVLLSKDFRVISSSRVVYRQALMGENERNLWNASILIRPCLVQDTNRQDSKMNALAIAEDISTCFKENIVRLGNHRYSFSYGLPQGWRLSEGLCNLYYGKMDSKYFRDILNRKDEFFITSVDDYLYITPDPERASLFYKKMASGMPDFGCKSNESKIFSNIDPRSDAETGEQECEWVNFCGWRFCLTCGHIIRDFTSYKSQDMASTLSFNPRNVSSPENFLISRMKIMLPARLQFFLLDPAINCRERILLNIFDAGFVFAFRFYSICRVIFPTLNSMKDPSKSRCILFSIFNCTKILTRMILNVFRHTYPPKSTMNCKIKGNICSCIKHCTKNTGNAKRNENIKIMNNANWKDQPMEEAEIFYIVYHAFILKLSKHSQVFKDVVLPRLHTMKNLQASLLSQDKLEYLIFVLGQKMPSHFNDIKI